MTGISSTVVSDVRNTANQHVQKEGDGRDNSNDHGGAANDLWIFHEGSF
jgi:hypothetical protein